MLFKRAGGLERDMLNSCLAPQASVVKGRESVEDWIAFEEFTPFFRNETAKMSIISAGFLWRLIRYVFFPLGVLGFPIATRKCEKTANNEKINVYNYKSLL